MQQKVGKIESKRTAIDSNCNRNEGTMKFETSEEGFANKLLNVLFSHHAKELRKFVSSNKLVVPL